MPDYRYITDDYGQIWEILSTPMADEWPAGDPVTSDRETLNHIRRIP